MFFYGEDSAADNLSLYIDAAPTEEQKYFLATQQVDEARHAVFFHRFFKEVIGAGETIGETLASTQGELNWGYRGVFDRLDRMADELRAFTKAGTMPGFSEGMHNISRDEQRHIGFGVKTLSEMFAQSEECKAAIAELLGEVLPCSLTFFVQPNRDLRYTREYGFELEDIYAFGLRSVRAKWRAAGYPIEEMPAGVFPLDLDLGEQEIARRQVLLLRSGVTGAPGTPIEAPSPEVQRIYFDIVENAVDHERVDRPLTIQWRFSDADNRHLHVDNGATRAEPGDAPRPDVALETSCKDWIDVSMHGVEPWRAVLGRRLRPRGSVASLRRMQRLFPRRPTFA